jgi:hypothetical protein
MANMSRSEAGRLGARALNLDPKKKSTAAKKAAETRKKDNPNIFREMGAKGGGAHGKDKSTAVETNAVPEMSES